MRKLIKSNSSRHSKKGQFAVEHILVVGLGILLIIPIINLFYNYSSSQTEELASSQLQKIGNGILDNAETVYYMGTPSKITIEEHFPKKIINITILEEKELVFYYGSNENAVPFFSNVRIKGPYYQKADSDNDFCNETTYEGICYTDGIKKISLLASKDSDNKAFTAVIIS